MTQTLTTLGAKGESIAVDLAFAVFIFLLVASSLVWVWSNKAADFERDVHEKEMQLMVERALDTLVSSPGKPSNWEEKPLTDLDVIGLAKRDRVLDEEKINKLTEFVSGELGDYDSVRQKLLIGANDYYFRVVDPTARSGETPLVEIGMDPSTVSGKMAQATVKRPVTLAYHREGMDEPGKKSQHEAIAELTLFSTIRTW